MLASDVGGTGGGAVWTASSHAFGAFLSLVRLRSLLGADGFRRSVIWSESEYEVLLFH